MLTSYAKHTLKYILALSFVGILSMLAYFTLNNTIEQAKNSFSTINASGKQRMLSQRLAFLCLQLTYLDSEKDSIRFFDIKDRIFKDVREMHHINKSIINGDSTLGIVSLGTYSEDKDTYERLKMKLDEGVKNYLYAIQSILNRNDLKFDTPYIERVIKDASGELLIVLDDVVSTYEAHTAAKIKYLQTLERYVCLITIIILLLEGLFIFRPMVARIMEEQKQIKESKQLLSSILNTVGESIITLNKDGQIIMANQETEKIWDIKEADLKGQQFTTLVPPELQDERQIDKWNYVEKGISSLGLHKSIELRGTRKDNQIFPLEIKVTKITLKNSPFYTVIMKDIEDKKNMELAVKEAKSELEQKVVKRTIDLQKANQQLTQEIESRKLIEQKLAERASDLIRSNAELEQFAYIASHDLREPLRMIAGYVQLLQARYKNKLDKSANDFIDFAVEGAVRANKLLDDLLKYSRLSNKAKFSYVNLNHVMQQLLTTLNPYVSEHQATINVADLPNIYANELQITHLFKNLISNSIKFKNGSPPIVDVSAEEKDDCFQFAIKDNGIGIDKAYTNKIFLIFQRLHTRNKYEGNGVGLALCKKIVEQHDGKIWFESELGRYTTFYFTIPKKIFNLQSIY